MYTIIARSIFILTGFVLFVNAGVAEVGQRGLAVRPHLEGEDGSKRVAVVVGNGAYDTMPLANPVNDARSIAEALTAADFDVIKIENASKREIRGAVREMGNRLRDREGSGLFFFAGHGVQSKGKNFLIPVGENIRADTELQAKAVQLDWVLDEMGHAGNKVNIVILDACRNNPLPSTVRSSQAGLAAVDAPNGTYIAYATSPGMVALDSGPGDGGHSVYTKHLLAHLRKPGLRIEDVFMEVRKGVVGDTDNAQLPWDSSSLLGKFYFLEGGSQDSPEPDRVTSIEDFSPKSGSSEIDQWKRAQADNNVVAYRSYLASYPEGTFSSLAKIKLKQASLRESANQASVPEPAKPVAYEPVQEREHQNPRHGELSMWVQRGRMALAADQLTTPAHDNAAQWARHVLAVDPDNADAKQLLKDVVERYIQLSQDNMRRGGISEARSMLDRGRTLSAFATEDQLARLSFLENSLPAATYGRATRSVATNRGINPNQYARVAPQRNSAEDKSAHDKANETLKDVAETLRSVNEVVGAVKWLGVGLMP